MRKVIIDTDPGIDDALALILALRSPELNVLAITVVAGNIGLDLCLRNAAGLVAFAGSDVPIAPGCDRPLIREPLMATHVHGDDGLGNASDLLPPGRVPIGTPAPQLITELAARHPDEVTLITIGPMTNAAVAFLLNPSAFRKLRGIIAMGGAFRTHGNVTAAAEFNIFADPHAAKLVLGSGVPLRFVGLDVTTHVSIGRQVEHADPLIRRMAAFRPHMNLHDPLAVGCAINEHFVTGPELFMDVETEGQATLGMTLADFRPDARRKPNATVGLEIDATGFLKLFNERVLDA